MNKIKPVESIVNILKTGLELTFEVYLLFNKMFFISIIL